MPDSAVKEGVAINQPGCLHKSGQWTGFPWTASPMQSPSTDLPAVAGVPGAVVHDSPGMQSSVRVSCPSGERPSVCSSGRGWHPGALTLASSRAVASGEVSFAWGSSMKA